jgi:hypothetical protein
VGEANIVGDIKFNESFQRDLLSKSVVGDTSGR